MTPPVGKSGPFTISARSSVLASGFSMRRTMASQSSLRLWGGMFVAMPTAMPEAPLASRLGRRAGSGRGSGGGGRVVVDRAEVALAVHQRVAHGEVLGQAHHRLIDGAVAVGVVLAQDLADDTGALLVLGAGAA